MILPGSLTYRTYGYLMVAYAVEKQWGAANELALVRRGQRTAKKGEGKGRRGTFSRESLSNIRCATYGHLSCFCKHFVHTC